MNLSQAMLFHAILSWPSYISTNLQPFIVKHTIDLHNMILNESRLSLLEIFMGLKSSFNFNKFYTFGSPVFVLELTLQQEHKISCQKLCSKLGVCVGKSHKYAGNISLVLDPLTSFVSPQFHLVHDDEFTSLLSKRIDILPLD